MRIEKAANQGPSLKYRFFCGKNSDEGQTAKKEAMIQSLGPEAQNE